MRNGNARLPRMGESGHSRGVDTGKPGLKERVRDELREYAITAGYLFVCFAAVLLYKAAVLDTEGVRFLPLGLAATKALILGKLLLLLGSMAHHTGLPSRSWLRSVPMKTLVCFVALLALLVLEETLVGFLKGHTPAQTLAEHKDRSAFEILAECLLLLLMLFPLMAANEYRLAEGERALGGLLRGERSRKPD